MNYHERFVGWRYLRAKPFQTIISVVGVFLGIVVLIVAYSIWSGLEAALRERLLGSEPHLIVWKIGSFTDYARFIDEVEEMPKVVAASPAVVSEALIQSRGDSRRRKGAQIRGVDPQRAMEVSELDQYLASHELNFDRSDVIARGKAQMPDGDTVAGGIILGEILAQHLRAEVGDPLRLYTDFREVGTSVMPIVRTFVVVDLYKSGLYEIDSNVAYMDIHAAQDAFGVGENITQVEIRTDKPHDADAVKRQITQRHGLTYVPRTWQELRGSFFAVLRLEKIGVSIIFGLIVLVAGFSIAITLVMLVNEKTREIGILKAMGMPRDSALRIFVLYGTAVGAVGVVAGGAASLLICAFVKRWEIPLPSDVYQIEYVPVLISWRFIGLVSVLTMAMCWLMSFYPAWRAANLNPVEALRYE